MRGALRERAREAGLLLLVAAAVGALTSQGLDAPFDDSDQGWSGGYYGLAARNYGRYGAEWLGAMLVEPGAPVEAPRVYANHPPMAAWVVAAGFAGLGEGPLGARIGHWLLSMGAAAAGFGLLRRVTGDGRWAAAGVLLAAACPAWAYYGSLPDPQGSGVLLAILAACWAASRWYQEGVGAGWILAALGFGMLSDWPSWFAAAGLAAWAWWLPGGGGRRLAAGLLGLSAAVAAGLAAWIVLLYTRRGGGPEILEGLLNRTGLKETLADDLGHRLSWGELWAGVAHQHLAAGWAPLSLLGLVALVAALRSREPLAVLLTIPALTGALHTLTFPQGAYVHLYWQLYLVVGLALPIAWLGSRAGTRWRPAILAALLVLAAASGARAWLRTQVRWSWTAASRSAFQDRGLAVRRATAPDASLASSASGHVALDFYSDRRIDWGTRALKPTHTGALEPPGGALEQSARARWGEPLVLADGWLLWVQP